MSELDKIIEKKYTIEEIGELYNNKEINDQERIVLYATSSDGFLDMLIKGNGLFKIEEKNVDPTLYFTNVDALLRAFYSLHNKFPGYHFDKIFEYILESNKYNIPIMYNILTILYHQLENEKKGYAPFKINNPELLTFFKGLLKNPTLIENLKKDKSYRGQLYNDGLLDVYKQYNDIFKDMLGVDMFEQPEQPNQSVKI